MAPGRTCVSQGTDLQERNELLADLDLMDPVGRGVPKLVKQAQLLNPGYFHPFLSPAHPFQYLVWYHAPICADLITAALRATERARRNLVRPSGLPALFPSTPRAGEAVELYEVSVHQFPGVGTRLVSGRTAGADQQLRFYPYTAGRGVSDGEFMALGDSQPVHIPWPITGRE